MNRRSLPSGVLVLAVLLTAPAAALAAPALTASAAAIDFSPPEVMVGFGTPEFHLTLTSTGADPLDLYSVDVVGTHRTDFRVGGCSAVFRVATTLHAIESAEVTEAVDGGATLRARRSGEGLAAGFRAARE
jgi:hypothetical protein